MDDNTRSVIGAMIMCFVFFGWIPILAFGKAIAMIVEAWRGGKQ